MLFETGGKDLSNKVEWWFTQGYFDFDTHRRHYFMNSFFQVGKESGKFREGFTCIAAELEAGLPSKHRFFTWDSSSLVDLFLESRAGIETNLSSHLVDAYCSEVAAFGSPAPIKTIANDPVVDRENGVISWDTFTLSGQAQKIDMVCDLPISGRAQFELEARRPFHFFKTQLADGIGETFLRTCPRLELKGEVAGRPVSGRAWFDHQASNHHFFHSNDQKNATILGWDWLGLNMDNGMDMVIFVYRDLAAGRVLATEVYLMHPDGKKEVIKDALLEHLRYWRSSSLNITYPSLLRLTLPSKGLSLDIEPLAADQEIPIPGVIRGIWEGAGKATGTLKGQPVSAHARMEFYGYGFVFDSKKYLTDISNTIDKEIEAFFPRAFEPGWFDQYLGTPPWRLDTEGCTTALSKPVWDLMDRNGKHWRPVCATLFLESLEIDPAPYRQLLYSVSELNHTGSLIIDDIEDDACLRRGDDAIHLRYGVDTAINAGNSIYFLPYLLLKDHQGFNDHQRMRAYELMVTMLSRCHIGQGLDIHWRKELSAENLKKWMGDGFDQKLLQMYAYKTGAQVEGLAEMACIIADASQEIREVYGLLGRNFGVAFQIVDDVHNFSDAKGWKKTRGEDIRNGTPTYVIVKALKAMNPGAQSRFMDIITSAELRQQETCLNESIGLVTATGVLQTCHDEALSMMENAWKSFTSVAHHNNAKIMLKMFFSSILNYSYKTL